MSWIRTEGLLRSSIVTFTVLFSTFLITGAEAASDGRNRPTQRETNGTERYQLASFDFHHVETPYVISLWILLASVAKIGFHLYNKLSSIFPESCLLIVMGVVVGIILYFSKAATSDQYTLSANTFFLFLLPPIVLDAGYFMPSRAFFDNIGTILLFAVVGTLFNTVTIGLSLYGVASAGWIGTDLGLLHSFVFSSLISAVDPVAVLAVFEEIHVNEMLFIIVFGESLLNDAVTVVLYHMMESYSEIGQDYIQPIDIISGVGSFFVVGVCGTLIGLIFGLLTGFITKYTDHVRVIEPLFVFVLAYLSYLTSEMLHLSGILAIVFCGISMKQYVEANVSQKSHTTIKYFMKMLSNISETVIFMFLGLSTVVDNHDWNVPFILFTVLFTLVYRALGVILLTWVANRIRLARLSKVDQFVMSYGGLRGAIAFCLVLLLNEDIIPQKKMMVTACIVVIFFTVFVQGITIKPLVDYLKVKRHNKRLPTMNEQINERMMDHIMAGIEDIAGYHGHHYLRDKYEQYNNKYLKPILMRDKPKTRETEIFHVFTKLNMKEAMEHLAEHGSFNILDMTREPSLAKIIRNYSSHSLNDENGANGSGGGGGGGQMDKSDTVLDMAAVEAKYTKKMADDGKIHHMLDDAMFGPRKRFSVTAHKHELPEVVNHPPFKHNFRKEIRRLLSHDKKKPRPKSMPKNGSNGRFLEPQKPHKSVTFSYSDPVNNEQNSAAPAARFVAAEDEDVGIVFTVRQNSTESDTKVVTSLNKTAVEAQLPWRRETNGDDCPSISISSSWTRNHERGEVGESGSPILNARFTQLTETGKQPTSGYITPTTNYKTDDTDSALAMSIECLNTCSMEDLSLDHESRAGQSGKYGVSETRSRNLSHGHQRDSGVIDSEEYCDSLKNLSSPTTTVETVEGETANASSENTKPADNSTPEIRVTSSDGPGGTTEETKL